jgi:lysophospholipase L1-like esterase
MNPAKKWYLSGMIGSAQKPMISSIAFMGDSITSSGQNEATIQDIGNYTGAALAYLGHAVQWVEKTGGGNFQTGGFTPAQIRDTWLPAVITADPDACFVHAGTNGLSNATASFRPDLDAAAASHFAVIAEIVTGLKNAGIIPILATIIPDNAATAPSWPPTSPDHHPDMRVVRRKTNDLIRAHARSLGAILCDWAPAISTDPADDAATAIPGYLVDELHPNWQGAMVLGRFLADRLQARAILPDPFSPPASDSADWFSANPYLTGGTTYATGWDGFPTGSPAPVFAASKTAEGWQRLSITDGPAPGQNRLVTFYRNTTVTNDTVDGMPMFAVADIRMPADTTIWAIGMECQLWNVDTSVSQYVRQLWAGGSDSIAAMSLTPPQPYNRLLLKTPIRPMPSGTGANRRRASFALRIYGSGVVDIVTAGVIKAP